MSSYFSSAFPPAPSPLRIFDIAVACLGWRLHKIVRDNFDKYFICLEQRCHLPPLSSFSPEGDLNSKCATFSGRTRRRCVEPFGLAMFRLFSGYLSTSDFYISVTFNDEECYFLSLKRIWMRILNGFCFGNIYRCWAMNTDWRKVLCPLNAYMIFKQSHPQHRNGWNVS